MMNTTINTTICRLTAAAVLSLSLWVPPAAIAQHPERAAWRLVWFAITTTPQGPLAFKTSEQTPFGAEADCAAFGERMMPRMHDWVRGLVRADWDHDVRVAFDCEPSGMPS